MIKVRHLSKHCGRALLSTRSLSWHIRGDQTPGAQDGVGRATALRIIVGFDRPTASELLGYGRAYETVTEPTRVACALFAQD